MNNTDAVVLCDDDEHPFIPNDFIPAWFCQDNFYPQNNSGGYFSHQVGTSPWLDLLQLLFPR